MLTTEAVDIALYVVEGTLLFCGVMATIAVCAMCCCECFRCRYLLYFIFVLSVALAAAFFCATIILSILVPFVSDSCATIENSFNSKADFEAMFSDYDFSGIPIEVPTKVSDLLGDCMDGEDNEIFMHLDFGTVDPTPIEAIYALSRVINKKDEFS